MTLRRLWRDVRGATMVEYALVLAFFAILAAIGFQQVATSANTQYSAGTTTMTNLQESPLPALSP
jgi:Flp pilus assembly pilin Flp